MATLESIATELVEYANANFRSRNISNYFLNRINGITYTNNGKSLSIEDKLKLLDIVEFKFRYGPDKNLGDVVQTNESENSSAFIELVKMMRKDYKNGK